MPSSAFSPSEVPLAYGGPREPRRLRPVGRLLALVIGFACLTVLVVAAQLNPSGSGTGTHLALGFQPCQFLDRTGLPCPSCGMTTSFAWFARGHLAASFFVQPMGTVGAVLTCATAWAALFIALTGKPAHRLLRLIPIAPAMFALFGFAILAWGWKMVIVLKGLDGWR